MEHPLPLMLADPLLPDESAHKYDPRLTSPLRNHRYKPLVEKEMGCIGGDAGGTGGGGVRQQRTPPPPVDDFVIVLTSVVPPAGVRPNHGPKLELPMAALNTPQLLPVLAPAPGLPLAHPHTSFVPVLPGSSLLHIHPPALVSAET